MLLKQGIVTYDARGGAICEANGCVMCEAGATLRAKQGQC